MNPRGRAQQGAERAGRPPSSFGNNLSPNMHPTKHASWKMNCDFSFAKIICGLKWGKREGECLLLLLAAAECVSAPHPQDTTVHAEPSFA